MKFCFFLLVPLLACSTKYALHNSEFHDLAVITENEPGQTLIYRFESDRYAIEYFDQESIPKTKYVIEEGTYTLQGRNLLLTPASKLFCEIFSAGHDLPCHRLHSFSSAYLVQGNAIDEAERIRLGFVERTLTLFMADHRPMFVDPALEKSVYTRSLVKS